MMMGGGGMHAMFMGSGGREKKRPSIAMYKRLLRFVQPYRSNLVLAAALLILSTVLSLVVVPVVFTYIAWVQNQPIISYFRWIGRMLRKLTGRERPVETAAAD